MTDPHVCELCHNYPCTCGAKRNVLKFNIDYPPTTGNHAHWIRNGRRVLRTDVRDYFSQVSLTMNKSLKRKLSGPVRVRYAVYRPKSRPAADLGNIEKLVSDAIARAGVIRDDKQIKHLTVWEASAVRTGARVTVEIEEMDNR